MTMRRKLFIPAKPALILPRAASLARTIAHDQRGSFMLMGVGGPNAAGGGVGSLASGFVDEYDGTISAPTITVAAASLGIADANRVVALAIGLNTANSNVTINSVTIAGVSATAAKQSVNNGANPHTHAEIWYASIASGTSGDIAITCSAGTLSACRVAVYALNATAEAPSASGGTTAIGQNCTATINLPAHGYAIFTGCDGIGSALSWTVGSPITDYNTGGGAGSKMLAAHYTSVAGETAHSVTLHAASTDIIALAMASWAVSDL